MHLPQEVMRDLKDPGRTITISGRRTHILFAEIIPDRSFNAACNVSSKGKRAGAHLACYDEFCDLCSVPRPVRRSYGHMKARIDVEHRLEPCMTRSEQPGV